MPDHCRAFGVIDGVRAPFGIIGGHLEMSAQLRLEIVVMPGVAELTPDADDPLAQGPRRVSVLWHYRAHPSSFRRVCMMFVIRSHSALPVASCRRPAAVIA